jgi:hypothetical protein
MRYVASGPHSAYAFRSTLSGLLIMGTLLVAPASARAAEEAAFLMEFMIRRFPLKIDPKTPVRDLLPTAPDMTEPTAPWLIKELAAVPQMQFEKPIPHEALELQKPSAGKANPEQLAAQVQKSAEQRDKAMERIAHVIARINHLNEKGTDQFLKVLRQHRPDVDGLPFVMGDACRQNKDQALAFTRAVERVNEARLSDPRQPELPRPKDELDRAMVKSFWDLYDKMHLHEQQKTKAAQTQAALDIAALMQMLAPEGREMHHGLVAHLAGLTEANATRALARLALFSFDAEVRKPALEALKTRERSHYTDLLVAGLRYPWAAVAENAGNAVVALDRTDLVPQLIDLLDQPDARAPAPANVNGKAVQVVREVVRINHHRNCLLCHPPGNTPDAVDKNGFPTNTIVVGPVPSPGQELPSSSQGGYGSFESPDILVRADATYLRQDFSLLQPVKDAAPWPEMQRFDFLVRTRVVTNKDAAAYAGWLKQQGSDYLAPHRQAALTALRALTSGDAAPTAEAWRAALAD